MAAYVVDVIGGIGVLGQEIINQTLRIARLRKNRGTDLLCTYARTIFWRGRWTDSSTCHLHHPDISGWRAFTVSTKSTDSGGGMYMDGLHCAYVPSKLNLGFYRLPDIYDLRRWNQVFHDMTGMPIT